MIYEKWVKEWKSALAENFFLRFLCILLAVCLIINVVFFRKRDRIILVPPKIEKEFWVEDRTVSEPYLEQMGVFIATLAGNMSPVSAEYNAKIISSYTDSAVLAEIKNEIAGQAAYFKKNNITQSFFPTSVRISKEKGTVQVEGTAIRYVGGTKVSSEKAIINVRFRAKDYSVKIEELYMSYPDREEKKIQEKEEKKATTPEERREPKKKTSGGEQ